jgi:murein DD-endopeptidase MepM/ murein hydrolase activator NlpD
MPRRLYQRLGLILALALAGGAPPLEAAGGAYAGWHLPVPAGEWTISRGPCGAESVFDHECGYYENQCAVDLVPLAGSMENVPVLAPQAGQVFFVGQRAETGRMLMLLHPDGRVSGYMHLAKIVVGADDPVTQGQVVAYAGRTGTVRPHLHFFVQPNAVERACASPAGLDTLDFRRGRAVSGNLSWSELILADPPPALPDWLPALNGLPASGLRTPQGLALAPGTAVSVPVLAAGRLTETDALTLSGGSLAPTRRAPDYALFRVPLLANTVSGDYEQTLEARAAGRRLTGVLQYSVRPAPVPAIPPDVLLDNPQLAGPAGWTTHNRAPELCWRLTGTAPAAGQFRVLLAGPAQADSGWMTAMCWRPPQLAAGTYFWKVFWRDAQGAMNRPNQRPFAFVMRP